MLMSACTTAPSLASKQQTLAADIYAQLAIGYMASGHLQLALQRLHTAQKLGPSRPLTLAAESQWQNLQPIQPEIQEYDE
jgi:Tfp pilus assembly protein PilF